MKTVHHAMVIGGGIAGPIAALALRKAGIDSTVYEAYASSAEGMGGMLMLAPNGLDALGVAGVDFADLGHPIARMIMEDGRGKRLTAFDGVPGLPPSRVVRRSDLYKRLRELVSVEPGKRLSCVEESKRAITARFEDGSAACGDVLIGADGIHSAVRRLIDEDAPEPEYVGLLGFGGYAEAGEIAEPRAMHFVFGERAFFGYWTEPDGRTAWFSNVPSEDAISHASARKIGSESWLSVLRAQHASDLHARHLLEHTAPPDLFALGALHIMPKVPRWYRGRMVIVGDAAHAPSSSSGQGASLAAESAVQIARCLRDAPTIDTAFSSYEELRRARVERVAADAARVNGTKALGPVGRALMSLLMPIATRTFLKPERRFGAVHAHKIDWNERVSAA